MEEDIRQMTEFEANIRQLTLGATLFVVSLEHFGTFKKRHFLCEFLKNRAQNGKKTGGLVYQFLAGVATLFEVLHVVKYANFLSEITTHTHIHTQFHPKKILGIRQLANSSYVVKNLKIKK